jgi:hypothetical protein
MDDSVRIEIEVTPEAASLLQDETRRRSVGRMISELVRHKQLDRHRCGGCLLKSRAMRALGA